MADKDSTSIVKGFVCKAIIGIYCVFFFISFISYIGFGLNVFETLDDKVKDRNV